MYIGGKGYIYIYILHGDRELAKRIRCWVAIVYVRDASEVACDFFSTLFGVDGFYFSWSERDHGIDILIAG